MICDPGPADDLDHVGRACGLHDHPQPCDDGRRDGGADERDGSDEGAGQLAADGPVDEEAGEGKQRNQPEIIEV